MPERFTSKFESADSWESADSLRENHDQAKYSIEKSNAQKKSQEEFDSDLLEEIQRTDKALSQELKDNGSIINQSNLFAFIQENYFQNNEAFKIARTYLQQQELFGLTVSKNELRQKVDTIISREQTVSKEDQIKGFKENLQTNGKSSEQILRLLLNKFGNETEIPALISNWQKFLRLHELAKTKSPQEQRVIQRIISNADFTSESAFSVSLSAIQSSVELSDQTKLEISMEFNGADVHSIRQMDSGLQFLKSQKQKINSVLNKKVEQLNTLNSDIKNLENQIDDLLSGDEKRKELEDQLSQKKDLLNKTKVHVEFLETERKRDIVFEIRSGFFAKLNPDSSRSLKNPENFSLKLPSNALPFTGMKNRRTVNLSFVCSPLIRFGILDEIFSPNLESDTVPMKVHRDMGHFILDAFGIDDNQLLSETNIAQLDKDLARLTDSNGVKSSREHFVDLGIYNIADQSLNMKQFKRALVFVKENRHLKDDVFSEKLKASLSSDSLGV